MPAVVAKVYQAQPELSAKIKVSYGFIARKKGSQS